METYPNYAAQRDYKFFVWLKSLAEKNKDEKSLKVLNKRLSQLEKMAAEKKLTWEIDPAVLAQNERLAESAKQVSDFITKQKAIYGL